MEYRKYIEVIFCLFLVIGMTCFSSLLFVDGALIPKWICLWIWVLMVMVFNSIRILLGAEKLYVWCNMTSMILAFILASGILSVYGILQHENFISSVGYFRVVGTFDNPVGFISAISFMMPFVLLGFISTQNIIRSVAQITMIVIFIVISLSESRTGLLSALAVMIMGGHKFVTKRPIAKWIFIIVWSILLIALMYLKQDSASGRILIWNVTWEMICDNWLFGLGPDGFASEYMNYQAAYLLENPREKWVMLADNIQHPFNEFLYLWVSYGVVIPLMAVLLIIYIIRKYMTDRSPQKSAVFLSLVSVFIFSMFSYPFKYPFTWFITFYSIAVILQDADRVPLLSQNSVYIKRICVIAMFCTAILICSIGYAQIQSETRWAKVVSSGRYENEQMTQYEDLYNQMENNRYFLYNYAYALYHTGDYTKASNVIKKCSELWADYDVQILSGMIAEKRSDFHTAEKCFDIASAMCPNRFRPHYLKMKLYEKQGDFKSAVATAETILVHKIKIPSKEIVHIINEAKNMKNKYVEK